MKLGLFGGSFDPVHAGHVTAAREARRALGLDRVLFLPTADPPHKPELSAPAHARFAMVELALLGEEGLETSPHELTPGRTAYTVETLEHFHRHRPDDDLYLLLGSDAFAGLHGWKRWRDLPALATLVVLARPGWDLGALGRDLPPDVAAQRAALPAPRVVERTLNVSATAIRQGLRRGRDPAAGQLAPLVLDYVHKYRLYR